MSLIAEMALRRARGRINSIQSRTRAKAPADKKPAGATKIEIEWAITGPINLYMYRQGREWAIDLVAALRASPVDLVIERLTNAANGRPGSYVAGIKSVVAELSDGAEGENLVSQVGRKE